MILNSNSNLNLNYTNYYSKVSKFNYIHVRTAMRFSGAKSGLSLSLKNPLFINKSILFKTSAYAHRASDSNYEVFEVKTDSTTQQEAIKTNSLVSTLFEALGKGTKPGKSHLFIVSNHPLDSTKKSFNGNFTTKGRVYSSSEDRVISTQKIADKRTYSKDPDTRDQYIKGDKVFNMSKEEFDEGVNNPTSSLSIIKNKVATKFVQEPKIEKAIDSVEHQSEVDFKLNLNKIKK